MKKNSKFKKDTTNLDVSKKKIKKIIKKILVLTVLLTVIILAVKFYFVINLLFGNDVVLKIESSKDNLFLKKGDTETLNIKASLFSNPFCSSACYSEMKDLSENIIISTDNFSLQSAIYKTWKYPFVAEKTGSGQEIYRFEVKCKSKNSFFCQTNGEDEIRSVLITLNYEQNDSEKFLKEQLKNALSSWIQQVNLLYFDAEKIEDIASNISILDLSDFKKEIYQLKRELIILNSSLYDSKSLWENLYYEKVKEQTSILGEKIFNLDSKIITLNESFFSNISSYNYLIEILQNSSIKLQEMRNANVSNETSIEINRVIEIFNSSISDFQKTLSLEEKESITKEITRQVNAIFLEDSSNNSTTFQSSNLSEVPQKILVPEFYISNFSKIQFIEPLPKFCLFGVCNNYCYNCSEENYPIILLHGHAFNKGVSAEYSLSDFEKIQIELEKKRLLSADAILISSGDVPKGIWSQINTPITVRASYYFDIFKNSAEASVIQTKSDSLDTYALRLKEIIEAVEYKTSKKKVVIVAHSMGGLVARRYVQIFGGDQIDKLVMIGTPNHGIESTILKFCSFVGESLECRDIDKGSLFLNKLNYDPSPKIKTYNIIAVGCDMDGETGDGIVKNSSAYLESAQNYYINGTCDELKLRFLHEDLLKRPEVYPGFIDKIYDILQEKE